MSQARLPTARTAADLRREFDLGFAAPPAAEPAQHERFLAVRIGGDPYVIRLAEIGGIYAGRHIAPMPSTLPALLGVAGFRGQIAPVYDLAALLGYPARAGPRWLVLTRSSDAVALGFDAFDAQWVVPAQDVVATSASASARPHVRDAVRANGELRPVAHLASVLDEIRKQVKAALSIKEA